jgi:hypothetical protein
MEPPIYKLYAIMFAPAVKGMNGNRGRMATQAAHAFLHSYWDSYDRFYDDADAYRAQPSAFKMSLVTDDAELLRSLAEKYRPICGVSLVEERGTRADGSVNEAVAGLTALGIGPIRSDLIADDLKALKGFV